MARPQKKGLDYFPLDVTMDKTNDDIEMLEAKYVQNGFKTIIKLYMKIYSDEGYYVKWNEKTSCYEMSSGNTVYANHGIFGLAINNDRFTMYEGYDSRLRTEYDLYEIYGEDCGEWGCEAEINNEDTKEIALYMSDLWLKLYNKL